MDQLLTWREILVPVANAYHLDPYRVESLVWVASKGQADKFVHDPRYWIKFMSQDPRYQGLNPRRVSSWYGLMQVHWVWAHEQGFDGDPEGLFLPRANLHMGCKRLRAMVEWADSFDVGPEARQVAALAAYVDGRGGQSPGHLRPNGAQWAQRVVSSLEVLRER